MARPAASKAGRNEARKLMANALNNMGVAFTLAGILQPALAVVQQERWPTLAVLTASLIFIVIAGTLFTFARSAVHGLED